MKITNNRKRKAISPVLATVILIAITLIAAIAVAGFVFGLFGTFTSSATLQLAVVSCYSGSTGAGNIATSSYCILSVTNTGGSAGSVTACSVYGTAETEGKLATATSTPPLGVTPTAVPAGTTSAAPIYVGCDGMALTSGAVVSGIFTVASGSPLSFTAVAH